MTRKMSCAATAACAVLWLAAGNAQADHLDLWYESWVYGAEAGAGKGDFVSFTGSPTAGGGRLGLQAIPRTAIVGPSAFSAAWIAASYVSDLPPAPGSTFAAQPFTIKLAVGINEGNGDGPWPSGSLLFTGTLGGSVQANQASGSYSIAQPTQSLMLGSDVVTVSLKPSSSWNDLPGGMLGLNSSFLPDGIQAQVDVQPAGVNSAPEPSSLVLAGLGLAGLGGAAWQRWRRRATAA